MCVRFWFNIECCAFWNVTVSVGKWLEFWIGVVACSLIVGGFMITDSYDVPLLGFIHWLGKQIWWLFIFLVSGFLACSLKCQIIGHFMIPVKHCLQVLCHPIFLHFCFWGYLGEGWVDCFKGCCAIFILFCGLLSYCLIQCCLLAICQGW